MDNIQQIADAVVYMPGAILLSLLSESVRSGNAVESQMHGS